MSGRPSTCGILIDEQGYTPRDAVKEKRGYNNNECKLSPKVSIG
jgi:hypothetical protein